MFRKSCRDANSVLLYRSKDSFVAFAVLHYFANITKGNRAMISNDRKKCRDSMHPLIWHSIILIAGMIFVSLGCSGDRGKQHSKQKQVTNGSSSDTDSSIQDNEEGSQARISSTEAIAIAEEFVKRDGPAQVTSKILKTVDDGYWIEIDALPRVPGGHCTVIVGFDGTISKVVPGA